MGDNGGSRRHEGAIYTSSRINRVLSVGGREIICQGEGATGQESARGDEGRRQVQVSLILVTGRSVRSCERLRIKGFRECVRDYSWRRTPRTDGPEMIGSFRSTPTDSGRSYIRVDCTARR